MDTAYLLPYVKSEGEEVFFSCNTLMPSDDIHWERDGAPLPPDSSISYGVLHIPNVTLSDEGTYKCIAKQGDFETETEFRLQVDDFVPVFFGSDSIEFKPLEDEQIDNLNIQLSVKPTALDGVLFATERRGEVNPDRYVVTVEGDRRPPVNQHLARLQNGVVIYEYDIGHGRDELVLPVPIPLNEWSTVEVKNEQRQASVTLNGGLSVKKDHPVPVPFPGTNKPLTIGRQSEEDQIRRPLPGLKGVVSEVVVSGESLPLARGEPTPGIRLYDACKAQPCANGGRCRKANRARGYTCACEPPFGGYQCETLSSKCKNADCNSGVCLEEGDSFRCVCPVNTSGPRCQRPVYRALKKSFAFLNKTSFLAVQSPSSLEQMKVSLRLRPQQLQGDRILLYTASKHGSTPTAHMSLSLNEGKLIYAQHNGAERQELQSVEIGQRELNTGVDVLVMRDKHGVSLVVNGRNSSAKNTVAAFSPNTDFYIGGFPPAFKAADGVPTETFMGCIEDVVINSKEIDLSTQTPPSSGDLIPCDELPFFFEAETTVTPTVEDLVTEETVTATEEPWTEPTKEEVTVLPTDASTTTITTEKPIVIGYTPKDDILQEIPWVPRPTTTVATTTTTTTTTTTMTTTEEPTTTTTEEPTTTTTPKPEPVLEEPMVPTEELTTETPTTTEAADNFYKTPKDGVEPSENISGSQEIETEPAKEENVTQCADDSCFVTTQKPDVCANNDCGANGRCEPYNVSHYECVCNLFYDGPKCGIFKPIEHAAHFNGDAFIEISADELPHMSSEKEESLSLRFKTTTQNGLLMWQGQQSGVPIAGEDYFSLAITNGYLHYSYELGGGAAHLVSPTRIADGKEHVVKLSRRGRRGSMYLDDLEEIQGVSSGILAMLNVDGNIFIGGIPNIEPNTGGLHEHNFIGCIADVRMNGEKLDLMGTAVDGKNVRPCEEWIEPKRHLRFLKKRKRLQ